MNDPIGDFITRIKNAGYAGRDNVSAPYSKMKLAIAELLKAKGFIGDVSVRNKNDVPRYINIKLFYDNVGSPRIADVKRVSKPSRRLYQGAKEIREYRKGVGMVVFSTPKGILSDKDARKENVGGEILFTIW